MEEKTIIDVIMVEPGKPAKRMSLADDLESMQAVVAGGIEEYMPFDDDVAIICNEEGKFNGMPLNRAIVDEKGHIMDVIAGPFFITYAPMESERYLSMPESLMRKYLQKFKVPEQFYYTDQGIRVIPDAPEKGSFER